MYFLSWVDVYRSEVGQKNVPKLVTVVINFFAHDGTPLDRFIQNLILKYFAGQNIGTGIRLVSPYKYYTTKYFGCKIVTKLLYRLSHNYSYSSMPRFRIVTSTEYVKWGQTLGKDS